MNRRGLPELAFWFPLVLVLAAVVAFFAWSAASRSRRAVFVAESLPRIEALARDGKYLEAFDLAREVERNAAASVAEELWELTSARVSVESEPAGAAVTIRAFGSASDTIPLGTTPLSQVRVPRGAFHWRVERSGYVPADLVTATPAGSLRFDLRADSAPDRDMIRIPAGEVRLWVLGGVSARAVGDSGRVSHRQARGDQPGVRQVCRRWRVHPRGVLEASVS